MIKVIKKLYVYYLHLLENGGKMETFEKYYIKWGVIIIAILAFFMLVAKPIYAIEIAKDTLDDLNKKVVAIGVKRYVLLNNSTGKVEQIRFVLANRDRH